MFLKKRKLYLVFFTITTTFLVLVLHISTLIPGKEYNEATIEKLKDVEGTDSEKTQRMILQLVEKLPSSYKLAKIGSDYPDGKIATFLRNIQSERGDKTVEELWALANSWVSKRQLYDLNSPYLGDVYKALKNARIIKSDLSVRGSQFKLNLTLEVRTYINFDYLSSNNILPKRISSLRVAFVLTLKANNNMDLLVKFGIVPCFLFISFFGLLSSKIY